MIIEVTHVDCQILETVPRSYGSIHVPDNWGAEKLDIQFFVPQTPERILGSNCLVAPKLDFFANSVCHK